MANLGVSPVLLKFLFAPNSADRYTKMGLLNTTTKLITLSPAHTADTRPGLYRTRTVPAALQASETHTEIRPALRLAALEQRGGRGVFS